MYARRRTCLTADTCLGPARDAVSYKRVMMDTNIYEKSDFIGQPRPELDAAWDGLLKYQYQAVRPSQLAEAQSVTLNDVTGRVIIQLEAYHTLNCLNFVRKFAFRTYYNMTDDQANIQNFGQCLERVRQTTMCYGDISVSTYVWAEGHLIPFPNFRLEHECRDWSRLETWAMEHKLPPLGDEVLKHPTYGATGII
ncbi:hypothetical protein BJ166DRAFT_356240 [Pestalotiopsis sp. NC0098]|nr:hypothetical protein BJ166DRAFT_356240 [Pestalotiopsis sp. NC0098]